MDEFKKYLNKHRDDLDTDTPGEHLWEKLQKDPEPAKGLVIPLALRWAVAACIILLAGFGTYILLAHEKKEPVAKIQFPAKGDTTSRAIASAKPNEAVIEERSIASAKTFEHKKVKAAPAHNVESRLAKNDITAKEKTATPVDPITKAFNDMQVGYASMVSIQMEKVKATPIYAEDANYFHVFKKQFQDLNNDERLLKAEIGNNGINDDIITRMINTYQEKIDLLKQLQFEINKMNNRVKNSERDLQKQTPSYINL